MAKKSYQVMGYTVQVFSTLTDVEFAYIGVILNELLGPHKSWATKYVFGVDKPTKLERLKKYLREINVTHVVETREQFNGSRTSEQA